jgi:hypothetical protein
MTSITAGHSEAAQPMQEEKKLTVLGHLEEVRGRLFKSIIAVVICIIICFPLARYIYPILMNPLPGIELYYTEVTGLLASYMKLALYGGLILAWPYLLYQFVIFLKPALTHKEKGYFYTLLPGVLILFIAGKLGTLMRRLKRAFSDLTTALTNEVQGTPVKQDENPLDGLKKAAIDLKSSLTRKVEDAPSKEVDSLQVEGKEPKAQE